MPTPILTSGRRTLAGGCLGTLLAVSTVPVIAQDITTIPGDELINQPAEPQDVVDQPSPLIDSPGLPVGLDRNPFSAYAAKARAEHRGESTPAELKQDDTTLFAEAVLTGPLIDEPTYGGQSRQSSLIQIASHQGIIRRAFDFVRRMAERPAQYRDRDKAPCFGGGTFSVSRIEPSPLSIKSELDQQDIYRFSVQFNECVLTPTEDWFTGELALHTQEDWARAAYSGTIELHTTVVDKQTTDAYIAYDRFTAVAKPHSVVLTGTDRLALTDSCDNANQQRSTVSISFDDDNSILYDNFVFGLLGFEKGVSLCSAVPRPVNHYQGSIHHSRRGVVAVSTDDVLKHRVDPQTLRPQPVGLRGNSDVNVSSGSITLTSNAGNRVELRVAPTATLVQSADRAPLPINMTAKPTATR